MAERGAAAELDLLGEPMVPMKDRRGRKAIKITVADQYFVAARAAEGWSREAIYIQLGICDETFRKYFSEIYRDGLIILEGLALDLLIRKAREGNVSAIKALQERVDRRKAMTTPKAKKPEAKGKKQVENEIGVQAHLGTDWGDFVQ